MLPNQTRPLLRKNGPNEDEIEIIGLEFTIDTPDGRNVELAMFSTSIIIPRNMARSYGGYRPQVTFHTSMGDFTLNMSNQGYCPW